MASARPNRLSWPLAAAALCVAALAPACQRERPAEGPLAATTLAQGEEPCAEWSCGPGFFDDGVTCDCACGCWDPDCDIPGLEEVGCAEDEECRFPGECVLAGTCLGWTCDPLFHDAADGCDCGCGCYDPDCDDPDQTVHGCAADETCIPPGTCHGAAATDPCDGWTCADTVFGALDGCHCGCGCWDPDCEDPAAEVVGCLAEEVCQRPGVCILARVCSGWQCDPLTYDAGDGCDCDCGCWDPDCDDPAQALLNCEDAAGLCVPPGTCRAAGPLAPCAEWTCAPAAYGGLDGCDCACGCWDPDCDLPAQEPLGCAEDEVCRRPGECVLAIEQREPCGGWLCAPAFFGAGDGCDCRCGCWDVDCDRPGQPVLNCSAAIACLDPGLCECLPDCRDRACGTDGCGGSCGSCPAGRACTADGRCVAPCVPECGTRVCGGDGCGGRCGTCGAGTVCRSGDCEPCTPACEGRECGTDGCDGQCGRCGGETPFCIEGRCEASIFPDTEGGSAAERRPRRGADDGSCAAAPAGAATASPAPPLVLLALLLLELVACRRRGSPQGSPALPACLGAPAFRPAWLGPAGLQARRVGRPCWTLLFMARASSAQGAPDVCSSSSIRNVAPPGPSSTRRTGAPGRSFANQ